MRFAAWAEQVDGAMTAVPLALRQDHDVAGSQ